MKLPTEIWMCENEQARWFEFEQPYDLPNDVTVTKMVPEQPEQEPVALMFEDDEDNGHKTFRQTPPSPEAVAYLEKWNRPAWVPLYTSPPAQRKPLRGEQFVQIARAIAPRTVMGLKETIPNWVVEYGRAIEAAHGIKE